MAKEFFARHNIAYEERNVAVDEGALKEMVDKSHQFGVPVIEVNGQIFVGFDRRGLAEALGLKVG
jgi:glutaredoxin